MTKAAAINEYFNKFITAYPSTAVPEDASYPYMTYEYATDDFDHPVSITVQAYFHTESEAIPNAFADELADDIGRGGVVIPYDGGAVWMTKGTPFVNSLSEQDNTFKRRIFNITLEFIE